MNDRRQQILDAALAAFLAQGYAGASIADIRARSGASTGSIYHFFGGKAEIALALLDQAILVWSEMTATRSGASVSSLSAERSIRASIEALALWGGGNPALFRFFDEVLARGGADPALAPFTQRLARGQAEAARLYGRWVAAGEVRPLDWHLAHALMVGPTYAYLRGARSGVDPHAIAALSDAAWAAVRAH